MLDEQLNLAIDLFDRGEVAKSLAIFEMLREKLPENPAIAYFLGTVFYREGRLEEARPLLAAAVDGEGGETNYRHGFGLLLFALGDFAAAAEQFQAGIENALDFVPARLHLANCQGRLGEDDQALETLREAARIAPEAIEPCAALGLFRLDRGDKRGALADFQRGLGIDPGNGRCLYQTSRLLVDSGRLDEALDLQKNAPGLTPDGTFQASLAMALLPTVPASKAEMMRARKAHETAIGRLAEVNCTIDENTVMATGSNFLAAYQGLGNAPGQRLIADFYRRNCPALDFQAPHIGAGRETGGLIRVGFVSTNFYNHTIGKLYRGIIAGLDRARFQVITFSTYPPDDEISRFIERHSDRFEILPEQLAPARRILAAAALDILFYPDIGMAPLTYFLAFARLAPMQCAGWGHPVTTGIDSIDYFISSTDLEPPDPDLAARQYSETLFRGCLLPSYLHPPETSTVNVGPDLAFAAGRTIYICPQSLFKIHPDFDDLLARILEGDEQAVFVFIEGQIGWSQILRARWGSLSARLADRVHFVPRQDQNGFRALIETSHVVLDTVHFSGGLSSAEILTLGKPIVTWPSASLACGRVTHAYYRQMGVTECTAKDLDDYVRIALRLGTDAGWRRQVESKIKENSDKLFRREDALEELAGFLENAHAAARDGTKLSADLLGRAFDRDETGLDGTTGADLL